METMRIQQRPDQPPAISPIRSDFMERDVTGSRLGVDNRSSRAETAAIGTASQE
jgi:hypothetical protein